jgi:hypothetical protein
MYLGTQIPARSDDDFRIMTQLGVTYICANAPLRMTSGLLRSVPR